MICLKFNIDDFFYGLCYEQIVEIVPCVALTPIAGAPEYVAGYFNYRGRITPVIDLTMALNKHASPRVLGSRIVVVNYENNRLLGLLLTNATETMDVDMSEDSLQSSGIKSEAAFMGEISITDGISIQLVNTRGLIPPEVQEQLYQER
ncbi:MAG: chemotaxis protein CheW [Victivallales bacterium]|nr:chemotaxis protein CheW [Victivallales bacterium]